MYVSPFLMDVLEEQKVFQKREDRDRLLDLRSRKDD